jgi:hypothetical protein
MKQKELTKAKYEILKSFNEFILDNGLECVEAFLVRSTIVGNFSKLRDILEKEKKG